MRLHVKVLLLFFILTLGAVQFCAADEVATQEEVLQQRNDTATFIKVSDIPEKAVETLQALSKMKDVIALTPEEQSAKESIPAYVVSIDEMLNDPFFKTLKQQNVRDISRRLQELSVYVTQLKKFEGALKQKIELYDARSRELESYSTLWSESHMNATDAQAPQAIMEHIASVIVKIEALRDEVKILYDTVLTFSQLVTTRILAIEELMTQLQEVRTEMTSRVFYKNSASYTELLGSAVFDLSAYVAQTSSNIADQFNEVLIYIDTNSEERLHFLMSALLCVMVVFYFYYLYIKQRLFVLRESVDKKEFFYIARPFSTALMLIALMSVLSFSQRPHSFSLLMYGVILIPIIRIMTTLIRPKLLGFFYGFMFLDVLLVIEKHGVGSELVGRSINIVATLALITLFVRFRNSNIVKQSVLGAFQRVLYSLIPLIVALLVISVGANLYGAVLLSERIVHGVTYLIALVFVFRTLTVIISGYVVLLLRRRVSTASHLLERYAKKIEKNMVFFIKLAMSIWWFWGVVIVLDQQRTLAEAYDALMAHTFSIGKVVISVNSIVDFIIIMVGTWVTVKVVNTILTVEVFSRFTFARGIPTAIKTTSNYIIVIAGTLMAFTTLGVTAEQFAIIFGALGVGIGFGLRNIIANFISGIIMVFERPVQIGDTVEIDSTMGNVKSIGTRATAIRTFDGSEVIIPNADFIVKKVINWTLTDDRRRKTLLFKVDFDSDIDTVLQIMKAVATEHGNVLKDPQPLAAFQGFGEYYLEFKLYFWLSENLIVAQSDIAIEIYRRLQKAGIRMPLPKQEFVSKSVDEVL